MFERKFEFTVHHPLEVCEERVQEMKTPGCLTRIFQPISSELVQSEEYAEFHVFQIAGKNAGYTRLEGIIEPISETECIVSGVADVRNIWFIVTICTLAGFVQLTAAIRNQSLWLVIFLVVWYSLVWIQYIHYRNRLINTFEEALTQQKKKKA